MSKPVTALERLIAGLPDPTRSELLLRFRKLQIVDDDDSQLLILELLGIWGKFFADIPERVHQSLDSMAELARTCIGRTDLGRLEAYVTRLENVAASIEALHEQALRIRRQETLRNGVVGIVALLIGLTLRDMATQSLVSVISILAIFVLGGITAWVMERRLFHSIRGYLHYLRSREIAKEHQKIESPE
jgi:hypothetical protein